LERPIDRGGPGKDEPTFPFLEIKIWVGTIILETGSNGANKFIEFLGPIRYRLSFRLRNFDYKLRILGNR